MTLTLNRSRSTQCHHLNNLVVLEHLMLHTKFQGHRPFGFREDFIRFLPYMGHGGHLGHVTKTV